MKPLELLKSRAHDNWLVGQDNQAFLALTEALIQEFAAIAPATGQVTEGHSILLAESDPVRFLAGFLAAHATAQRVFLGNPDWGAVEWQQALAMAQPDRVWGDRAIGTQLEALNTSSTAQFERLTAPVLPMAPALATKRLILIPTGGSSGHIRFVAHHWETLAAAVWGLQQCFQSAAIHSICTLPLYHVSGLMQFMRSLLSGGALWLITFQDLKTGPPTLVDPSDWFISLVPTQLQALLENAALAHWLAQCKTVFIGGAPSWPALLQQARSLGIPLAPCYGMTETAAQIATLKPAAFLAGNQSVGQVLPHAQVMIVDEHRQPVAPGTSGQIQIAAASLAWGYYPTDTFAPPTDRELTSPPFFPTDDMGFLDDQGYLTLVGRLSNKIITGGENVFPAEVEAAIRATGLVTDIAVLGTPDPYWGQCVTAVYVPHDSTPSVHAMDTALQANIARFKRPKVWVPVEALPRNAQGKLNHQTLQAIAAQWQQAQA
ncbi:MAG: 2-succinylbenzoate--CoA ligase [Cyanobacteria bacterium P01_F01_bin.86]